MFNISMIPSSVQNYLYLDLRNNRKYTFLMDECRNTELTVKEGNASDVFYNDDLKMVNVFSSIAAGKPIYMSGDVEEQFPLPVGLLTGSDDHFILKVRGDSMEGARIKNGDWVVIKRQQTAENRDIVAVAIDEDATLKRFMKMGDTVLLIPENEKYEPIHIRGDQARIIGVEVGIIEYGKAGSSDPFGIFV